MTTSEPLRKGHGSASWPISGISPTGWNPQPLPGPKLGETLRAGRNVGTSKGLSGPAKRCALAVAHGKRQPRRRGCLSVKRAPGNAASDDCSVRSDVAELTIELATRASCAQSETRYRNAIDPIVSWSTPRTTTTATLTATPRGPAG